MNKKTIWIIVIIIAVLAAAVALFAILNAGNVQDKKESQESATATITRGDQKVEFDLAYIKSLDAQKLNLMMDTSETDPTERSFTGVPLAVVAEDLGVSLDGAEQVIFMAADGYTTAVTGDEAADPENVYIVYERDGQPSGTKAQGGTGPMEIVIAKDDFAQRWCKFLMDITIE
jgi:hypothetical protein